MPKIVGTRERIHQPFYDSLIRVDGAADLRQANVGMFGAVQARSQLFTRQGSDLAVSNLTTGGFFPSDQTFVTLAVRVWTYFRFNWEASRRSGTAGFPSINGDAVAPAHAAPGVNADRIARVHKLYHQTQNQLFWQFQAGDKPQLTTYTAYTPFAGGLDGFFTGNGAPPSAAGAGAGAENFLANVGDFLVLAGSTITNTGPTIVNGDIGLSPGSAITGFFGYTPFAGPGIATGSIQGPGPATVTAQNALTAAFLALQTLGLAGTVVAAELGGNTFLPGVYQTATVFGLTLPGPGVVTLDGGGDQNAVFIFYSPATIITGAASSVVLTNGAQAHNVYWVAGSSITLGTTSAVQGNLLALTAITLTTGASVTGRVLARNAAVTFDSNLISADPNDPNVGPGAGAAASANSALRYRYRANNGVPTSSSLMRLARPILIPPRQGFTVIAIASPIGQATGASVVEQLNGLVPNNDAWGPTGTGGTITGTPSAATVGTAWSNGLSVPGCDDVEKDVKYLVDGLHSRDVL